MWLQAMVNVISTADMNLKFGTNQNPQKSKTKCIAFLNRLPDCQNLAPIRLNKLPLPWVNKVLPLECTLESNKFMKADLALKLGKFVSKVHSFWQ